MSLAEVFIHLFDDPVAHQQVCAYRPHIRLRNFNLATTSLRHIQKWYDRLSDIDHGIHRTHGNYYSDPQSIGLIRTTGSASAALTSAGREFLNTAQFYYDDPARAEYALNKILYYGGHTLAHHADIFLNRKRRNLMEFLRKCRPTPNTRLVLNNDRLLTMAEILSSFGAALEAFLLLDQRDLLAFAELGEQGFNSLLHGVNINQGFVNLAGRIAGDYTRAAARRRNYLLAHLFLSHRSQLISSGSQYLQLAIPYPYANLLTERTAYEEVSRFTDDVIIEPEAGGYIVFLREIVSAQPIPAAPSMRTIQLATRRPRTRTPRTISPSGTRPRTIEPYFVEAPLAIEAENHVERTLRADYGDAVLRIGHTQAETVPLSDGLLPGADIIVQDSVGDVARYIEVKSARGNLPPSIRLTAAEYTRALKCSTDNIPYDLYIVAFPESQLAPSVSLLSDFQVAITGLTISELLSMEIRIEEV